MRLPHTTAPVWPPVSGGRFAARIRSDAPEGCAVALLGLPDDTGVSLNHGRPGARLGPSALRAALARFGADHDAVHGRTVDVPVFDAGDIVPAPGDDADALLATHARVRAVAADLHARGLVTVGLGGGHDLTLPVVTGAHDARGRGRAFGGVNLDAHLDVRPTVGSGMPFRRLIEAGVLDPRRFVELGIGRFANAADHHAWLAAQGGHVVGVDDVLSGRVAPASTLATALPGADDLGFVTFDLDGLDGSVAPGVSAVSPHGLRVGDALALADAAGADPRVVHVDLMELSPPHDVDGRTARVAALILLTFLAAWHRRPDAGAGVSA